MFPRLVGDVDWPPGDTATSGVERTVFVGCLEHVPVRQDVEMRCEERVVRVTEYMERVTRRDTGEEIVTVAQHEARFVEGQLRVENCLWKLRHAGDCFDAEVTQGGDGPGVLVCVYEAATLRSVSDFVEHELRVGFYRVDAAGEEKSGVREGSDRFWTWKRGVYL